MSDTEREALEAGTVWWDGELFTGRPDWNKLLVGQGAASCTAEEQAFLDGPCEELCRMIDDWDITHRRADLPPQVWEFIKRKGFFAMIIPKKYGGLEFSALRALVRAREALEPQRDASSSTVGGAEFARPRRAAAPLRHRGAEATTSCRGSRAAKRCRASR